MSDPVIIASIEQVGERGFTIAAEGAGLDPLAEWVWDDGDALQWDDRDFIGVERE